MCLQTRVETWSHIQSMCIDHTCLRDVPGSEHQLQSNTLIWYWYWYLHRRPVLTNTCRNIKPQTHSMLKLWFPKCESTALAYMPMRATALPKSCFGNLARVCPCFKLWKRKGKCKPNTHKHKWDSVAGSGHQLQRNIHCNTIANDSTAYTYKQGSEYESKHTQ